jgi:hypothetical protein
MRQFRDQRDRTCRCAWSPASRIAAPPAAMRLARGRVRAFARRLWSYDGKASAPRAPLVPLRSALRLVPRVAPSRMRRASRVRNTRLQAFHAGDRIRTCDLRIMIPLLEPPLFSRSQSADAAAGAVTGQRTHAVPAGAELCASVQQPAGSRFAGLCRHFGSGQRIRRRRRTAMVRKGVAGSTPAAGFGTALQRRSGSHHRASFQTSG